MCSTGYPPLEMVKQLLNINTRLFPGFKGKRSLVFFPSVSFLLSDWHKKTEREIICSPLKSKKKNTHTKKKEIEGQKERGKEGKSYMTIKVKQKDGPFIEGILMSQ